MWVVGAPIFLEHLLSDLIDVGVLFGMAWSSLIKFCASRRDNNIVVSPFENLHKDDHLLILHQVERLVAKVGWICQDHLPNLLIQLTLYGRVKMTVAFLACGIGCDR